MSPAQIKFSSTSGDALDRYVVSVRQLNSQIHRIRMGENEIADRLSRAAAALRSMAAARVPRPSGRGESE